MARILVFTGDGKGKTTAAAGMALRAWGRGLPVRVVQFCKAQPSGECLAFEKLDGVDFSRHGRGFIPKPESPAFADHRAAAEEGLQAAAEAAASGAYRLIVLDEINVAVSMGLLPAQAVADLLAAAPADLALALTGRNAPAEIVDLADTVSEIRCVKHGYEQDIPAQEGVEL